MADEPILRPIAKLDLSRFRRTAIEGNRNLIWRSAWYLVSVVLFQSVVFGLVPSSVKAKVLRAFGAKIGRGLVCKPRVIIKYPWFLSVGDHSWIGEGVWIDNLCAVELGSNVCLSQGVVIITGSHDWNLPHFPFFARPVKVGDHVWVTAFRVIRPGVTVPQQVAVTADLSAMSVRASSLSSG